MTEDWYRSPDYSQEAMSEFQNRLSRARPHNRAQYLRIKAGAVAALRVRAADEVAISLLRRIISESPEIGYEVNVAHEELGAIYERMEQFQEAESEYRQVVAAYAHSRNRAYQS